MSEQPARPQPAAPLRLDVVLVPEQTTDDTDAGWGAGRRPEDAAADLQRFLAEKPPHHGS